MILSDFPVPVGNNKFGMHLRPDKCQDMSGRNFDWHYQQLYELKTWGCQWVNIITSPGGGGERISPLVPGCSELTFGIANELDFSICLRIFGAATPPYWYGDVQANLRRLVSLAKRPFYVKPNNEIDIEWETDAGRRMSLADAKSACRGVAEFINRCWQEFGGMVIPAFLNVGYGGTGWNFFEIMNGEGSFYGDQLDKCWVPVHPYNGPTDIWWPWCETLMKPILLTKEEYDARGRWAWQLDNIGARQTFEFVNAARQRMHDERMHLWDEVDLEKAYARGYFTHKWALNQLDRSGHPNTPVGFPEMGTEVGSMIPGIECVGPARHMELNLAQIADMQKNPRILFGCFWFNDANGAVQENWRSQGWKGPVWDVKTDENMPEDWKKEIVVPGELPIVSYLREHPIGKGEVMGSKLGPHIQITSDGALAAIRELKPPIVKTMDLNPEALKKIREAWPGALIVARAFEPVQHFRTNPVEAGQAFAEKYRPVADWIDVAEVYNEAINNTCAADSLAAFDAFQNAFICRLAEINPHLKAGLFCLPTGNLGYPNEPALDDQTFPLTFKAGPEQVYVCVHEYTWPSWVYGYGAYMTRYRKQMAWAAAKGYKLLVTECGLTHAIMQGEPDLGWRSGVDRAAYIGSLRQYDAALKADAYVVGAAIFTVGPSSGWDTFESLAEWRAAAGAVVEPEQPPADPHPVDPPAPPSLPALKLDPADVLEKYGLKIVPSKAPVGAVYYRVVSVRRTPVGENNLRQNVFVNVLDQDGKRDRSVASCKLVLGATVAGIPLDKPDSEPWMGNAPLWPHNVAGVTVQAPYTDGVDGLSTDHPDEGDDVKRFHFSFELVFQAAVMAAEGPTTPPVDPPTPPASGGTDLAVVRRRCWDALGIPYNPQAAFQKYASAQGLGAPKTREMDTPDGWRFQGFEGGIVLCKIGEWDKVDHIPW